MLKTLNIKIIRIDGGTQSRVEIDSAIVAEYADAIRANAVFPPMVVFHDGADYWLADGFHRWHAYNAAGKVSAEVDVRTGTVRMAILFSLGANGSHGLRRTNADKRKVVESTLYDPEWSAWSDRKIADVCDVSAPFVGDMRRSICNPITDRPTVRTVERAGKTYQQDTKNVGKTKPPQDKPADQKPASTVVAERTTVDPEDEYTELDAAHDQIEELQAMLAVASMGNAPEEDKTQATELICELRAEIKTLRATLKAITQSRDALMNELSQVKRQCMAQQRELKSLKAAADHA